MLIIENELLYVWRLEMEEKEVLAGRIRDLAQRTRSREYMTHTGFLTPAEQAF